MIKNEKFIYFFLLCVSLLVIWLPPVFLTQDGPSLIYQAGLLKAYLEGNFADYSQHFDPNFKLNPSWFVPVLEGVLLHLFEPIIVEKMVLTLLVVGFMMASRFLVIAISPSNPKASWMFFPLLFQQTFLRGFHNYSFGVIFMMLALCIFFSKNGKNSVKKYVAICLLSLLIYFCHPLPLAVLCFVMGIYLINKRQLFTVSSFYYMLAGLPAGSLFIYYTITSPIGVFELAHPAGLIIRLLSFEFLYHQNNFSVWPSFLFAIILWGVAIYCLDTYRKITWQLWTFMGLILIYLLIPTEFAGGGLLDIRIPLFIVIMLILYISEQYIKPKMATYIFSATAILSFLGFIQLLFEYNNIGTEAKRLLTTETTIPKGSEVAQVCFGIHGEDGELWTKLPLFRHISDYTGVKNGWVMLGNHFACGGYYPFVYKQKYINTAEELEADYRNFLSYRQPQYIIELYYTEGRDQENLVYKKLLHQHYQQMPERAKGMEVWRRKE